MHVVITCCRVFNWVGGRGQRPLLASDLARGGSVRCYITDFMRSICEYIGINTCTVAQLTAISDAVLQDGNWSDVDMHGDKGTPSPIRLPEVCDT